MPDPKPLAVTTHAEIAKNSGGNIGAVYFKSPALLDFEPGHPVCTIENGRFPSVLKALREKKLPPDQGPCADNERKDVRKAYRWLRERAGKDNLEAEVELLIDIMMPRRQEYAVPVKGEDGEMHLEAMTQVINLPNLRSYDAEDDGFEFVLNRLPDHGRESDDLMIPARILMQDKWEEKGSKCLLLRDSFEVAAIAAAIMRGGSEEAILQVVGSDNSIRRALGREAYITQIIGRVRVGPGDDDFREGPVGEGLAVFPNDTTMVHFYFHRTHPSVSEINILSDYAVMSRLHLINAEHRLRKGLSQFDYAVDHDGADQKLLDEKINAVLEIIKTAKRYFPENPEIALLHRQITDERQKRLVFLHHVKEQQAEQAATAFSVSILQKMSTLEDYVMGAGGIASDDLVARMKKKGGSQGKKAAAAVLKPAEIEKKVREIIDEIAEGLRKFGPREFLMKANASMSAMIEGTLRALGLPDTSIIGLRRYMAETGKQFEKPWVPEVQVGGQNVAEEMCEQAVLEKMIKLHGDVAKSMGKMPVEEVRKRAFDMIDHLVSGLSQFGPDSERLRQAGAAMGNLILKVLPSFGYKKELVLELTAHSVQQRLESLQSDVAEKKGKLPVDVVTARSKEMFDYLAIGFVQFGLDNAQLKSVFNSMGNFVTKALPSYGYPMEAVTEIKTYCAERLREIARK